MKKTILKLTLAVFALVCLGFAGVKGQQAHKLGYVNFQDLIQQMPEYKKASSDMEAYTKQLQTQLEVLGAEFDKKLAEYQSQEASMAASIKDMKQKELADMQTRSRDFQAKAEQDSRNKQEELLKPILDKAKKAISDVAKENNLYYVFDSSPGTPLLYMPESENVIGLVKKKLGISEVSTPTPPPVAPPAPKK